MSPQQQLESFEPIEPYPDGYIPASRRYIDYSGQIVIRTRYGTIQRWISEGWDGGRLARAPYILSKHVRIREHPEKSVMNDHLQPGQFTVYYVDAKETVGYEVVTDD